MSDDASGAGAGQFPEGYEPPSFSSCDGVDERCSLDLTLYGDYFTLGACIFFVAAHGILLAAQAWLAWRSRAWSFAVYLAIGTAFEVIGYSARVAMSQNPWIYDAFVIQLLMLILGPTLVAASISVTFKHLVLWYGPEWSFLKPALYPWVFVGTDFFSIVIQAAGGGVSSVATDGETQDEDLLDVGSGMLVAGVVFQAVNMIFCGGLMLLYIWRRHRALKNGAPERIATTAPGVLTGSDDTTTTAAAGSDVPDSSDSSVAPGVGAEKKKGKKDKKDKSAKTQYPGPARLAYDEAANRKVKWFIYAITPAYIAIIIRCIYRIPEMQTGWGSDLMQNETLFLIFDGAMILLAVLILTLFHPAFYFPFLGDKQAKKAAQTKVATDTEAQPEMQARA